MGRVGGLVMCLFHLGEKSKRSDNVLITLWWEESEAEKYVNYTKVRRVRYLEMCLLH